MPKPGFPMVSSSNSSQRRNGSQASCEPCRKGKVRCDHAKPVCSRCQRRGNPSACFYHPSPLSKRRHDAQLPNGRNVSSASSASYTTFHPPKRMQTFSSITPQDRTDNAPVFHYWPTLSNDESPINLQIIYQKGFRYVPDQFHEEQVVTVKQALTPLWRFAELEDLVDDFFASVMSSATPKPIILQLIQLLKQNKYIVQYIAGRNDDAFATDIALALLRKSVPPVTITPTTDPKDFCSQFSGENLRIETLGLIYSLAARAYCKKQADVNFSKDDLIGCLVRCSNLCVRIAREQSVHNNDVIVWLTFQNLQLISAVKGDTSLSVWRRVNDLATDVLALGLHRETTSSPENVPFFLAQSRKSSFTMAYHLDKLFAAILMRPVFLSSRYSDCKPPLDLSDEEVFEEPNGSHDAARFDLTAEGWNRDHRGYRQATRIRINHTLAHLREEVIDHQLRPAETLNAGVLRDLARRCDAAWLSVPEHLRFTPDHWPTHLPPKVCCMMGKLYLHYLHIHFQIQRIIGKIEGMLMPGLFPIAIKMIALVMKISNTRNTSGIVLSDIGETLLGYGLPAAMVLVISLQNDPSPELAGGVKRSEVLRDLVVFVSQLETATHQNHPDHDFCRQAAKGLSPMVDNLLQSLSTPPAHTVAPNSPSNIPPIIQEPSTISVGFNSHGLADLDTVDFDSWVANMDWTANNEWTRL